MKTPEDYAPDGASRSGANGVASSQKRRPPKLRPPRSAKLPTSSDEQSERSQRQRNVVPDRIASNSSSGLPNGAQDQNQDRPSREQTPEQQQTSLQPAVHHQRTTVRRESKQSAEPDQVQMLEREERLPENHDAPIRERRVQQMLSPEVQNQEIVPAQNRQTEQSREILPNGTGENAGQVIETTEAVTNEKGNNGQLKLRLDLNLDVEIELKAKIRGDVTLQLFDMASM
ncbi:uncharacterized protein N7498_007234 [Penicillium cinerascens]|uniref:Uncharacterized protein n=1 Tax=Penicillium cinerascens TaxID=70096 RepID=A0A9W9JLH9_9EURO|nr:uncharacterized protein N7498_007234 [Penicillium cinerascens]KAJ5198117.1 hypothetical protein N7498_007234 [Penicillium cinerascens]